MNTANNTNSVRKTITKSFTDDLMLGCSISTVGRWYDENHQTHPIHVTGHETDNTLSISAELPEVEAQDIAVDIMHGNLIILVQGKNGESQDERYHEMRLPQQVNQRFAEVEFSEGLLTVTFSKKRSSVMNILRNTIGNLGKRLQPNYEFQPVNK